MRKLPTRRGFLAAAAVGAVAAATAGAAKAQPQQGHDQHTSLSSAEKEKQAFPFLALKAFIEVKSEDTKGAVGIIRIFVPPGGGVNPHVHSREDEIFTVVRGHYRFRHGDVEMDAPPGTLVFMPKGIPHVFKNISSEPGEHITTFVPGGLEKMFLEASAAKVQMPRDADKLNEIFAKYGLKSLPPDSLPLSTKP